MNLLNICDYSGTLRAMKMIYYILKIVQIVLPIVIIITGVIIFAKASFKGSEEEVRKATETFFKRIISGMVVYLLPTFLMSIFNTMVDYEAVSNAYNSCNLCLSEPDSCTVLINAAEYNEEQESLNESKKQASENAKKIAERKEKEEAEAEKIAEYNKNRVSKKQQEQQSSGGTYNTNLDYSTGSLTLDWNDVTKISNVTASELTEALTNCTQFGGKAKNFLPYVNDLITAERKHNVNVFYLMGIYALESGWLTSNLAVNCNNIGGVKYSSRKAGTPGYSQCPGTDFAKYDTMGTFIDQHATLLETAYLTPGGSYYEGTTPDAVVIHYCPGGGTSYTDSVKSIGTGIFKTIA